MNNKEYLEYPWGEKPQTEHQHPSGVPQTGRTEMKTKVVFCQASLPYGGCGKGGYCHIAPVTRISQEALFALELTLSGAEREPPTWSTLGSSLTPSLYCQVYPEKVTPVVQGISPANVYIILRTLCLHQGRSTDGSSFQLKEGDWVTGSIF